MKVNVIATSGNMYQYINAIKKVDKQASPITDSSGSIYEIIMELNTIEDLGALMEYAGEKVVVHRAKTYGKEIMTIEIYDAWRE